MRLVCISDTHNKLDQIKLPEGDILLHSGDLTDMGTLIEVERFAQSLSKLDYKHIVCTPGNHDFFFESNPTLAKLIVGEYAHVLIEQALELEGINFYGAPYQPRFFDWAFNVDKNSQRMLDIWNAIPDNTNVLLTHGPAYGIMDLTPRNEPVGCELLLERIKKLTELKLHCFGHIHYSYGYEYQNGKLFANASICNERYMPINAPIVVDVNPEINEYTVVR